MRKRALDEPPSHVDPDWLTAEPTQIGESTVPFNRYFKNHPEQVLGTLSSKDTLYGEGYSVTSNGDLADQLKQATQRLPGGLKPISTKNPQNCELDRPESHVKAPSFVPPPPERHISEGSFFVHQGRIHQLVDGQSVPVVYGGTELSIYKGLVGKRMAGLIDLRDKARYVLRSQNEGWPEQAKHDARRKLNNAYDTFRHQYGPINKTTITETKNEGQIRRMPNVVKFREDPDAMLVMALEEYDEESDTAKKAPILLKDVVGKSPPITHVESAEQGLLVSLDRKGRVDLDFIAELYGKTVPEVDNELGDLIYHDPKTSDPLTADEYLSGNVRQKLKDAIEADIPDYVQDLTAVQPEDILPGDIDANLGAPWIPVSDIRQFAADLFKVQPSSITIAHMAKDAVWSVEGDYHAERAVPVTTDYGTSRASGLWLFELALNLKSPTILDPAPDDKRVVNQQETMAAKEKQKLIKEKFKEWVFSDPERTERLVRVYNDTYNNLRPRIFDGSHLDFPGISQAMTLRPHQKDGVWRIMSGGNTLLAHTVGAGKTGVMAAAAMKLKQTGLVKKPLVVVPNHLLEQFAREFQQWYPNAKLLVATKDDFTRERRKHLTAKIASGDWDAIIVTHSSFERIGMSLEYQERFLREQIAEYDQLLCERGGADTSKAKRNILKSLEKQKAAREEKLKELLAREKKDDGLVFDDLGVDHIFIDESQYGKNLEVATKMDRVAGIQTGGSERAFDLYMKCRYLHQQHPGHGVTFASGTPISNSMVEMYTQQRYLDPDGLKSRGIDHFDAWAASFGEVVEAMEISPDGKSLRPRSRFAKFVNIPELQQMFRAFADVQTAEMLNLPRPALKGGKPETAACPMSDEQKEIQDKLVERYERIRNGGVDPREDNALAITTDGRKLALDARMVSPEARDFPGSKINALVENIVAIHRLHLPTRGTQMVFCDMGVHPTPWGFSAYDEIIRKLVDRGIPREQIAAIGDADSDAKKAALFEKVRNGSVRVLIGSTAKLGTGTNVQKRLVALHHLDAPWKPAEVEQREGRILRQGNENSEVMIYRYVTEGSFDAYMWQALETKARFINQVMTGQSGVRRAEDVGGQELSYAEVKAIASGNPAVLTLAEADAELQRLGVLRRNHADVQFLARRNLRELPSAIERMEKRLGGLQADSGTIHGKDDLFIGGKPAAEATLMRALNAVPEQVNRPQEYKLGQFRGLTFGIEMFSSGADVFLEGQTRRTTMLNSRGTRAVMNALNRIAESYQEQIEATNKDLDLARTQLADFQARLDKPFPHAGYLEELTGCRDKLKVALSDRTPAPEEEPGPSTSELAGQIKALMSRHKVEDAPRVRAEKVEPIRQRVEKPVRQPEPEKEKAPEPEREPEPVEEEPDQPVTFRHRVVSKGGQMSLF